ncbi:acetyl-CoA acetyltransferase [Dermatobacter hominis]|uniref:acetyl-CoA acetyltransferase n=1 Tax=Dermatobacter hominis TaxID=2884263 RepID=UPI001D0FE266|nr:acetyl-CoA acetyltransferase [Dermatobacter hominis]UDY36328.1 acetyl-CoA acetyltransferase [Dermatobacter hominis]
MTTDIWVLGGYQSDFARNLHREGMGVDALTDEVVRGTLADAGIDATAVQTVHVGNAFGELFTGQAHLGAMPATVCDALVGVPAGRHEAACASGGVATRAAVADLTAGFYDVALVVGVELERTVPGQQAADHLGAAAWVGHEGRPGSVVWADMFDQVADEYDRRYGIDDVHLRRIGEVNLANAKDNPNAQTRDWHVPDLSGPAGADDDVNPVVEGRLRRYDCSQITDGGAGLVLVSDAWRREHPDVRPIARIAGWGHRTAGLPLEPKFAASKDDPYVMPHVRDAFADALDRAAATLDDLDALETHDCFTPSEYMAIDHIGLTAPGESWKAVESGEIERGGRLPVNPGGGLIGGGHPVGASGVRMVLDAARQVSGSAGDHQVDGARRVGTLNIGGSTATTVTFVVESADRG